MNSRINKPISPVTPTNPSPAPSSIVHPCEPLRSHKTLPSSLPLLMELHSLGLRLSRNLSTPSPKSKKARMKTLTNTTLTSSTILPRSNTTIKRPTTEGPLIPVSVALLEISPSLPTPPPPFVPTSSRIAVLTSSTTLSFLHHPTVPKNLSLCIVLL